MSKKELLPPADKTVAASDARRMDAIPVTLALFDKPTPRDDRFKKPFILLVIAVSLSASVPPPWGGFRGGMEDILGATSYCVHFVPVGIYLAVLKTIPIDDADSRVLPSWWQHGTAFLLPVSVSWQLYRLVGSLLHAHDDPQCSVNASTAPPSVGCHEAVNRPEQPMTVSTAADLVRLILMATALVLHAWLFSTGRLSAWGYLRNIALTTACVMCLTSYGSYIVSGGEELYTAYGIPPLCACDLHESPRISPKASISLHLHVSQSTSRRPPRSRPISPFFDALLT